MWIVEEIAAMLAEALREAEAACLLEQSPLGLDALEERASRLAEDGQGVAPGALGVPGGTSGPWACMNQLRPIPGVSFEDALHPRLRTASPSG